MAKQSADFVQAKAVTTQHAEEVLAHLLNVLLATPAFTLTDGSTVAIKPYVAPEIGRDGEATCGFDVILENGSHLEFTLKNSGWGKSFVDALHGKSEKTQSMQ